MLCGESLWRQLPAEARELANRDHALSRWMHSHIQLGLRYVPNDVAQARADVLRRLLAIAPLADCAAAVEGTITQSTLDRLFNELAKQDSAVLGDVVQLPKEGDGGITRVDAHQHISRLACRRRGSVRRSLQCPFRARLPTVSSDFRRLQTRERGRPLPVLASHPGGGWQSLRAGSQQVGPHRAGSGHRRVNAEETGCGFKIDHR